jgi:predicted transcriptional regulator
VAWFLSSADRPRASGRLGPLEWRVLEALWQRGAPAAVRDLQPDFPDIAYTTLMTTLDRLHRKGILGRAKSGRAFVYAPGLSRAEFESVRAADAFRVALDGGGGALALSYLVQAVGDRDGALLDELEALVKARRAEIGEPRK